MNPVPRRYGPAPKPLPSPIAAAVQAEPTPLAVAIRVAAATPGLRSRNVFIAGHRTSLRLAPAFWEALAAIASAERCQVDELITTIAARRGAPEGGLEGAAEGVVATAAEAAADGATLTAAVRDFILSYHVAAASAVKPA
ncbi:ribbon-helix-helix domain-containing protein [Azospirillum sp. RWY-5-1]|uniref:Ribbon-helix-helix domain-containing protein n=1 Tax=Azospirillum oleiclasticum TaxID=2735135 RepID=A0ABX2TBF9_9PROT|nr:ribbon-helix-helix domain-containing protein [Azospirillum oleiclasticum]NYZ20030.1 ribbon-helix-helix domain-containing protein [Azospirillum oleiclasticum]